MAENDVSSPEGKKGFWNRSLIRGVMIGAASTLLASIVILLATKVYTKGELVFTHNDIGVSASHISHLVETQAGALEKFEKTVDAAIKELEYVRRDSLSKRIQGKASRQVNRSRVGENRIYINSNSDARTFQFNEEVEIRGADRTIRAVVKGTITNENQEILCKLNADTAEELGITERQGIADVTISRVLDESLDEHIARLHP